MSLPHPARASIVDGISFNALLVPGKREVYRPYQIGGGQQLVIGSVLGQITATGVLVLCSAAAGDGSQVPMAVCPENIMTYDGNGDPEAKLASVIVEGYFNSTALVFGAGYDFISCQAAMRATGLHARALGYSG